MGWCLMCRGEKQAPLKNGAATQPLRRDSLLPEVSLRQALEGFAVTGFVAARFADCDVVTSSLRQEAPCISFITVC